jgi:hypothetical protein
VTGNRVHGDVVSACILGAMAKQWSEADFQQLLMKSSNLKEFLKEALAHYDEATPLGKALVDHRDERGASPAEPTPRPVSYPGGSRPQPSCRRTPHRSHAQTRQPPVAKAVHFLLSQSAPPRSGGAIHRDRKLAMSVHPGQSGIMSSQHCCRSPDGSTPEATVRGRKATRVTR